MGKRPIPKPFVRLRRRTFLLTFNVAILALGVPVLVQAFNAVTVSGFPLGFCSWAFFSSCSSYARTGSRTPIAMRARAGFGGIEGHDNGRRQGGR